MAEREGGSGGWHLPAAWVAAVGCGTALLLAAGRGGLATPALTDVAGWSVWVDATDPTVAVVAVLRLVGLGISWYLVGVTGLALLARVLRLARLARLADLLAVGPARPLVRHLVGAALAVGVVTGSTGGYVVAAPPPPAEAGAASAASGGSGGGAVATATMRRLGDAGPERTAPVSPRGSDVPVPAPVAPAAPAARAVPDPAATPLPTATPKRAATPEPAATTQPAATPEPAAAPGTARTAEPDARGARSTRMQSRSSPAADAATPDPAPAAAGDDRVGVDVRRVVQIAPGDHLWGLAAADVGQALGRPPADAEVVDHFAAVVAANADRLVVEGNPDLLVPGQQVVLPAVGGGP